MSQPTKETLKKAARWIRRELTKRADGSHPSHLAARILAEADERFALASFGVEGWAKSPQTGVQYLNYGDPYDATIVVRSNATRATVHVAVGGVGSVRVNQGARAPSGARFIGHRTKRTYNTNERLRPCKQSLPSTSELPTACRHV